MRLAAASVALLVLAILLASCAPAPTRLGPSGATPIRPSPAASPTTPLCAAEFSTPLFSSTPPLSPSPSAPVPQPIETLSPTSAPTLTPTRTATPEPTLPPLHTPAPGVPLSFSLGWRYDATGHLTAAATDAHAAESLLILSSLGRRVVALDVHGAARWQARTTGPAHSLAVLDGGEVAVGDDAGYVTLLDGRGKRLWRHALGSRVTALRAGWESGLLAGGWDRLLTLFEIGPGTGRVLWQADVGGAVTAIAATSDLALVATLEGEVRAYNAAGAEAWRYGVGAPVVGLDVIGGPAAKAALPDVRAADALALASVQDGRLVALGLDGRLRWQWHSPGASTGGPVWDVLYAPDDARPEIAVGTGGIQPALALLAAGGQTLWRLVLPAAVGAVVVLDLDHKDEVEILAGLASGEIQAYDLQGRRLGSAHAGLPVWHLLKWSDTTGDAALALADVAAWQVTAGPGLSVAPWLSPPPMLASLPTTRAGAPPAGPVEGSPGEATLVFLGDVALGRSVEAQLIRYGPAYPWAGLGPLLAEADLAVANLEGALTTTGEPMGKPYVIRAHPLLARTLLEAGLDLVSLANNHVLDYGPSGLGETLDTLSDLGLVAVGAGRSAFEARRPALLDLNGVRVAILGYAASRWFSSADIPTTDCLAWAEPEAVRQDVRAARSQADLVVVLLHAGTEYATRPTVDQIAVAHAAIDSGASLVVGHHPHVTQTVERYGSGLIVYSLGDALFDIPRQAAMQGDLLRVRVSRQGLVQADLLPFWIADAIRPRPLDDGSGHPVVRSVFP